MNNNINYSAYKKCDYGEKNKLNRHLINNYKCSSNNNVIEPNDLHISKINMKYSTYVDEYKTQPNGFQQKDDSVSDIPQRHWVCPDGSEPPCFSPSVCPDGSKPPCFRPSNASFI